jgi:glyoxylate utilization-related uncharacterized protein
MHTVMRAGGGSGGAYRLDATTIFVYVLRGELGITVDAHTTVLNTGGCLTFGATHYTTDAVRPMARAEAWWTISPPIPAEDFSAAVCGN